ncbi:MAG: pirin family protein [Candidatus Izemoplasmataceae bacterium]|jgi:quercetin 2,3-dioxygenase|uniref:pirin family protein n=1 Tax=Liberiplasma polymorphum TaxID=3374570 RepID=UPI003773A021
MFKVIRKSHVGKEDYGFVTIYHHFSFGDFYDKSRMGIGPLRVVNLERIIPKYGYDTHHHRDMEMINFVYKGILTHKDELGNEVNLPKGGIQYIRSGSGFSHSEWNHQDESLRMISIWIEPKKRNLEPVYSHKVLSEEAIFNKIVKIASYKDDALFKINQEVNVFVMMLDEEHYKNFELRGASEVYLVQIDGEAYINGKQIYAGDAVHATETLHIQPISHAHYIIIEVS